MTTATKGADLDRRMYALGPTALADEAASLLWDDGRRSLYAGDAAGCDAAAAPGLTPLQREVLGAATLLRRLCDEGPEWRVAACEALAAAPAAVDTALALLAAPPRFGAARAGGRLRRAPRPARRRGGRRGGRAARRPGRRRGRGHAPRARGPPRQRRGGDAPRARDGRGLALVAARGGGAGAPRARRGPRRRRTEGRRRGRAPPRAVGRAGPRGSAPGRGGPGPGLRRRRGPRVRPGPPLPRLLPPGDARVRVPARRLLSPRPRRLPAPRLAPAPGGLPRGGARAGRRPPGAGAPLRRGATRAPR